MRLFFIVLVFSFSVKANESIESELISVLSPFVKFTETTTKRVFTYNPDGHAYIIEAPKGAPLTAYYDFVLIYLFEKTELPEFKELNYKMPSGLSPKNEFGSLYKNTLVKYKNCCKQHINSLNSNLLQYLSSKYGIISKVKVSE